MLALYQALKNEIETKLKGRIFHVALFNNQIERSQSENPDETSFLYPCVFIQFSQSNFRNLQQGIQQYDLTITTHLGFKSFQTEDTEILSLKQDLYHTVQRFRNGYFDKLTRVAERQDYNFDMVQVYETDFTTTGKDYTKDTRPTIQVTPNLALSASTISLSGITI